LSRAYQRRMEQYRAIRIIQRNIQSYLKLRNWQWWRLFTKVKPLLQVTNAEEQKRKMEEEAKRLTDRYDKLKLELGDLNKKNDQVLIENQNLEDQLREEKFLTQEVEEARNLLMQKKSELENFVMECETKLEEQEEQCLALQGDQERLKKVVRDLEEQLEGEEIANQKLTSEKALFENKVKDLEMKLTLNEDLVSKVRVDVLLGGGGGATINTSNHYPLP